MSISEEEYSDENGEKTWTGWIPLETSELIWNFYIKEIGIKNIRVVDVWSFEEHIPTIEKPHFGLIICFSNFEKVKQVMNEKYSKCKPEIPDGVFFAQQKINNACGTFALIHLVAQNIKKIDIGDGIFAKWFEEAKKYSEEERSDLLANDKEFADAHKKFASYGETEVSEIPNSHYICYVNVNNQLYEFDSRMSFPRNCGTTSDDTLLNDAAREAYKLVSSVEDSKLSAIALVGDNNC